MLLFGKDGKTMEELESLNEDSSHNSRRMWGAGASTAQEWDFLAQWH